VMTRQSHAIRRRCQGCQAVDAQASETAGLCPARYDHRQASILWCAAKREVIPAGEHRSHKGLNNRAEKGHERYIAASIIDTSGLI